MVGEKREKWAYLLSFVSEEALSPLLNTTLFIHLGWEILCPTVDQTTLKVFSRVLTLGQMSPSHLLCRYVFKRSLQINHSSAKYPSSILTIPESVLTATFLQLDLWFRVVGLPATGRFLSTSAHYLERWPRNRQYLEICMHQWQVSRLWQRFTSLTFDQRIPWNVQHQLIHSHLMDCTGYFENHWHHWWSLSHLLTVYIIDW